MPLRPFPGSQSKGSVSGRPLLSSAGQPSPHSPLHCSSDCIRCACVCLVRSATDSPRHVSCFCADLDVRQAGQQEANPRLPIQPVPRVAPTDTTVAHPAGEAPLADLQFPHRLVVGVLIRAGFVVPGLRLRGLAGGSCIRHAAHLCPSDSDSCRLPRRMVSRAGRLGKGQCGGGTCLGPSLSTSNQSWTRPKASPASHRGGCDNGCPPGPHRLCRGAPGIFLVIHGRASSWNSFASLYSNSVSILLYFNLLSIKQVLCQARFNSVRGINSARSISVPETQFGWRKLESALQFGPSAFAASALLTNAVRLVSRKRARASPFARVVP